MDLLQYAGIGAGGVVATLAATDFMFPWIKYDLYMIKQLLAIKRKLNSYQKSGCLFIDIFEKQCRQYPQKPLIIFKDEAFTYEEIDRKSNQVANLMFSLGLKKGDTVAILMYNCPEYVWITFGLYKAGIKVAFLNHNLRQKSLLHCFNVSEAKTLIVGRDPALVSATQEIQNDLGGVKIMVEGDVGVPPAGMQLWDPQLATAPEDTVPRSARAGLEFSSTAALVNTSGTTGLPKAAIINQARLFKGGVLMLLGDLNEKDIVYTPLPLYHSAAGIVGLCGTVIAGATLVLRDKFSASQFWEDCRNHNVTVIQYIGELCRYLVTKEKTDNDSRHSVRLAFGNGLRPDVWKEFEARFRIPSIIEFYAATEGNAGFINLNNKFGAVGRCSPLIRTIYPTEFIKYDFGSAAPVRDANGLCIKTKANETGLLVVQIKKDFEFDGYQGSEAQNASKIIRNVFKKGDAYFNSGDLFTMDKDYFVYFADRIGDTFRWKGENVSTIEVSNVVSSVAWIEDANVYGVEVAGQDGRAGMASVILNKNNPRLDMTSLQCKELFDHCAKELPRYAVPMFVRIQPEMKVTSTFKQLKGDLVKEGFDPTKVNDALYYQDSAQKTFVPLDSALYQRILTGNSRL